MSKQLLYTFLLLLLQQGMHAQKEANIWYFGYNAGLDFNTGTPVPLLDGELYTNEGLASIAGPDGELMFYTDGIQVYNKNHLPMQNGNGLMGDTSTSQSAIIIPKPLSLNIYYIFTLTLEGSWQGLRYSEIDTSLDGGLGAVTQNKNVPLITPCTEQITAVRHANGTDIWVIVHGYGNNAFHAYLVTPAGVGTTAVTSNSGVAFAANAAATVGCMKASPKGTKLGMCNSLSGIKLFDFDDATGIISAPVVIANNEGNYGVEFSPSGNMLYTSTEAASTITQYNLTAPDIAASATLLFTGGPILSRGSLQLGPDGKIYSAARNFLYLSVIHNPDIAGVGCNAEAEGIFLGGPVSWMGLPNFVQSFLLPGTIRAEHLCFGDTTEFTFVSAVEPAIISWDFGDGNTSPDPAPTHIYTAAGMYAVKARINFNGSELVIEKNITIAPLPVAHAPENLFACDDQSDDEQESFDLSESKGAILGSQDAADYLITYHNSASDAELGIGALPQNYTNTTNPEMVYVRLQDIASGCYSTTSFTLNVISQPNIHMDDEYAFCKNESTTITAPAGFNSYLWSTGATTASITVSEAGIYTVTVTQDNGAALCHAIKTVTVVQAAQPAIDDIIISDWTDENNSITVVASGNGNHLYSINGIHYQESPIFTALTPGPYTVFVKDENGCGQATQQVVLLMYPRFFTPNGDGNNETWHIKYSRYEPGISIHIFDRYGKLIISLKATDVGWDGTLNGQQLLSSDYWFTVQRRDGREFKGHFSMLR
ncbi:MAG: T9SS type B sorting domain-containing protein [Bacteroidota bacterium]